MYPPEKGGNASRIHDLAVNLEQDSWNVIVLAPPPTIPVQEFSRTWNRSTKSKDESVEVWRLWTWQPQVENPGLLRRLPYYLIFGIHALLWLLVHRNRTDLVITTSPPISTGAPGVAVSHMGIPWVVDVRDLWIDASISLGYLAEGSFLEKISRIYQQMVFRQCDLITVTTETLGKDIQDRYSVHPDKISVIPNGVDIELFSPANETGLSQDVNNSEGLVEPIDDDDIGDEPSMLFESEWDSKPSIIYTGNLGSSQDLETCIRAMQHLQNENASLVLIGDGDVKSDLQKLTEEIEVADCVDFYDPIPRKYIPEVLQRAEIGLAPLKNLDTLAYAIPTKVYEYHAGSLPTVVMGGEEIARFVEQSNGGLWVPNDPEKLANIIDELLGDKHRRQKIGKQGHSFVKSNYDRSNIADQLSEELVALLPDSKT